MLPTSMFAMTADPAGRRLLAAHKPLPPTGDHDLVVRVLACGVCRTDLHILDGDLPPRHTHLVPGHRKGGTVVCAGIHMSAIPSFDYRLLWGERVLKSVANLTRADGDAFFSLADELALETRDANAAVQALRAGTVNGAAVLVP